MIKLFLLIHCEPRMAALDSTHVITAIPAYNGPGVIGADGDCLQKITATIDEMAVWNVALSTADINTIYTYQNTH